MRRLAQSPLVDAGLAAALWAGSAAVAGIALTLLAGAAAQLATDPGAAVHTGAHGVAATLAAWEMRPCAPMGR